MEDILGIDAAYPMKKYCSRELINEYHQYIMEFLIKTSEKESQQKSLSKSPQKKNHTKKSRKRKRDEIEIDDNEFIFIPAFDVESILDEKQDGGDDIQFKIRWKGWPKEYDSWTYLSFLDKNSLKLVEDFRRKQKNNKNNKNLGQKGFASNYWKEIYSTEWCAFMDGMDNGQEHADYCYYFFKKFNIHLSIQNIADFGFGHGKMLDAFVRRFRPKVMYKYIYTIYYILL